MIAGAPSDNEAHPHRLQFGFAPELEKLVHDKVESSDDLYVTSMSIFSLQFQYASLDLPLNSPPLPPTIMNSVTGKYCSVAFISVVTL